MSISRWFGGLKLGRKNRRNLRPRGKQLLTDALESRILFAVNFGTEVIIPAGIGPSAIATADFNADGKLDIAVANTGFGSVGILLGNGTGTFAPMVSYNTGASPQAIAIGDVNRDGILDLVLANTNSNSLSLLLGNANGTFQNQTALAVGAAPTDVAVIDIDHNGTLDLIVANSVGNTVGVRLGDGAGNFAAMTTTAAPGTPTKLALGDFDRNGTTDVITTNNTSTTINFLAGTGLGTFNAAVAFQAGAASPFDIVAADFNRDGNLDVAMTIGLASVSVMMGNGQGGFAAGTLYAVSGLPQGIDVGDIDSDGRLDLVVSCFNNDSVNILEGGANGTFGAAKVRAIGDGPFGVVLADVIVNSGLDLLITNNSENTISLLPNISTASAVPALLTVSQQPTDAEAGEPINPSIKVEVGDAAGNLVLNATNTVKAVIVSGPTGGKIIGTASVKAVDGVATFTNLAFSKVGNYTIKFASTGLTDATADEFEITAGIATKVVFLQPPVNAIAGATIAPDITVQIQDAQGNLVTSATDNVTLSVATGPSGAAPINGTLTVAAVGGIATFNDINLETAGSYTLTAASGALTTAKSKSFTVSADAASAEPVVATAPNPTVVGKALTPKLVVNIVDQFGNIVKSNAELTISINTGPGGAALSGTLTVKASNGKATFSNVKTDTAGAYTLDVTGASLPNTTVTFAQTVNEGQSTITTPKPAASYTFGQAFTLSSTLKSDSPLAFTGTVDLVDQNTLNVLASATPTSSGGLKFSPAGLEPGTYTVRLEYPGDDNHTAVNSADFTIQINKAKTTTVLTINPTSAFSGQNVVLTATVNASTGGSTNRTGNIVFKDNGVVLATVAANNSGAQYTDIAPDTGSHKYTAEYVGDDNFLASTSSTKSLTVKKNSLTGVLAQSTPNDVPINTDVDLTFTVTVKAPGSTAPTGLVTFKEGSTVIGTANIVGGVATVTVQFAIAGTHSIKAFYEGDANTNALTSSVLKVIAA